MSYFFNSFFGGEEAAIDEVTISYSSALSCSSDTKLQRKK